MMTRQKSFMLLILSLVLGFQLPAQTQLSLTLGRSQQDNFLTHLNVSQVVNDRLSLGFSGQFGSPNLRFIEAKPIQDEGYAVSLALPGSFKLTESGKTQVFAFFQLGYRWQGIFDPDGNDMRDSILNSQALLGEIGLMVVRELGPRLNLQSGISFPIAYELQPTRLFENMTTLIHAGLFYELESSALLYLRGTMGPSFGASGDSQKFLWSVQAGMAFSLSGSVQSFTFPTL
ncbi:MAG: hypothetical protein AAFR61_21405 [Bacteroidota bacterium]